MAVARVVTRLGAPSGAVEAADGHGPGAVGQAPAASTSASDGASGKPLTRPELAYLAIAFGVVAAGLWIGMELHDSTVKYVPPEGIGLFAVVFVVTQAIERLLEPLAPFFGQTKVTTQPDKAKEVAGVEPPSGRVTKSEVVPFRDRALAASLSAVDGAKRDEAAQSAAWAQEILDQIRRNTSTLWALASALGMIAAGWMNIRLLQAINAHDPGLLVDILVTGLVIGGGSKGLHELISNVQTSKEKKATPAEMTGGTAS